MVSVLFRSTIIVVIQASLQVAGEAFEPIGGAPASGIEDQAGVFTELEEALLAREIRIARERHGLEFYVASYPLLRSETVEERGVRLRNAWSKSPHAVVVVYDQSLGQLGFTGTDDLENFLSRSELKEVFARAGRSAGHAMEAARREGREAEVNEILLAAVRCLLRDPVLCHRMTTPRLPRAETFGAESAGLLGLMLVTIVALGGISAALERRITAQRRMRARVCYFPKTHMSLRLGAPFSGGNGVSLLPEKRD